MLNAGSVAPSGSGDFAAESANKIKGSSTSNSTNRIRRQSTCSLFNSFMDGISEDKTTGVYIGSQPISSKIGVFWGEITYVMYGITFQEQLLR